MDAPEPRGKEVDLRLYVDSDHAGDKLHRRSRTGYFIFLNSALVNWLSKKQATIETSVFGAEFVAMKHGVEALRGLRYKLRMMGVPLTGPSYVYGDNMSVIHNTQRPDSTLKKKSNSICYHFVREADRVRLLLQRRVGSVRVVDHRHIVTIDIRWPSQRNSHDTKLVRRTQCFNTVFHSHKLRHQSRGLSRMSPASLTASTASAKLEKKMKYPVRDRLWSLSPA